MDILSPLIKEVVRDRLYELVSGRTSLPLDGRVTTHQVLIRVRHRRFSLPWRGTFRGAMVPIGEGTLITGKFDSNWALYFAGYPILLGVAINIVVTILSGYGTRHLPGLIAFVIVSAVLCVVLIRRDRDDRRSIIAAICRVTDGRPGAYGE